jgi:chromosome segregation ATPase
VFAASPELSAGIKQALAEIARRRQGMATRSAALDALKQQRQQLVDDEQRLRANLHAVDHDTALYRQTLDQLGRSESQISSLSAQIAKATADLDTAKQQLETFVNTLTL